MCVASTNHLVNVLIIVCDMHTWIQDIERGSIAPYDISRPVRIGRSRSSLVAHRGFPGRSPVRTPLRVGLTAAFWSCVVSAFVAGLAGCTTREETAATQAEQPRVIAATVAPVERRDVERVVEVQGTLHGWERVTIGAKITGRVARVFHDIGDQVVPGDLLVELETRDAELAVTQAERRIDVDLAKLGLTSSHMPTSEYDVSKTPTVEEARLALDRARQTLARERSLVERKAGNIEIFQNAENDEKVARAKLESATLIARADLANVFASKAALDVSKEKLTDTRIVVPRPTNVPAQSSRSVAYAVVKKQVSEGQMVKEGEAVFDLVIADPLRFRVNIPERYSAEIRLNQPARIEVPAYPGREFPGKVARITPAVDSASRTFQVEILVDNSHDALRPGGFAKGRIVVAGDSKAFVAPVAAIAGFAGSMKIFVLKDHNMVKEVHIETVPKTERDGMIEITGMSEPIAAGDLVVTSTPASLADGAIVTIRRPASDEPTAVSPADSGVKPAAEAARRDDRPKSIDATRRSSL